MSIGLFRKLRAGIAARMADISFPGMQRISWQHLLFYGVVCDLPLLIGQHAMGVTPAGWINVDLLAVGILSFFIPRAVCALLVLAAVGTDVLAVVCQGYYLSPSEAVSNLSAVGEMGERRMLGFLALVLFVAGVAGGSMLLRRRPEQRKATALTLLVVALAAAAGNRLEWRLQSDHWQEQRWDTVNVNREFQQRVARAPLKWLVGTEMEELREDANTSGPIRADEASARDAGFKYVHAAWAEHANPDIALIVVESWGQAKDARLRSALVQAYSQKDLSGYEVVQGTVPFHGPTVSGEVRELCDSDGAFHILDAPASELTDCLPDRLAAMGYETTAIHGMNRGLFKRNEWYAKLGFQQVLFRRELKAQGLPLCSGAFDGICDGAIADWIGERLEQPSEQPRFTYWMTLNSHLPVPKTLSLPSPARCSQLRSVSDQTSMCNWYRLVENVHRAVARTASRKLARPTIFIVVGDHAPPFADPKSRARFDASVVPYVILAPKAMGTAPAEPTLQSASSEVPADPAGG